MPAGAPHPDRRNVPLHAISPLSVIIPAYNAASDVGATVRAVHQWLAEREVEHEILVVDDGSRDHTARLAREALDECGAPGMVLAHPVNRGKGAAVRTGMLTAKGRWALFLDVDHSTHISHVERVAQAAIAGADVVIGSRRIRGAKVVCTRPTLRKWLGDFFPALTRVISRHGVTDSQCGFKAVRRWAIEPIFAEMRIERFAFDIELLLRARRAGAEVREVPVRWDNPSQSTLRVVRDGPSMLCDAVKTSWRLRSRGAEAARLARDGAAARARVEVEILPVRTKTGPVAVPAHVD